eukprot:CAMPEP_0196655818 /NCGR_PEP_ID=MMETSP1086-20130531/8717_1 /TAXON_ID=77921 /ORGANISM="Cyanoptyche  gloeocystis , Strain SAG4.97" /LENGTH=112 /DNA_ID=CAMNT_0041988321 /DNA_START=605 /DNA_END=940 /DNA_ORIENTATION=-
MVPRNQQGLAIHCPRPQSGKNHQKHPEDLDSQRKREASYEISALGTRAVCGQQTNGTTNSLLMSVIGNNVQDCMSEERRPGPTTRTPQKLPQMLEAPKRKWPTYLRFVGVPK